FEFGAHGYRAEDGALLIREMNARPFRIPHAKEPIGEYLASRFLPCKSGVRGMYYDAVRRNLIVPIPGDVQIVQTDIEHRVRIEAIHDSQIDDFTTSNREGG